MVRDRRVSRPLRAVIAITLLIGGAVGRPEGRHDRADSVAGSAPGLSAAAYLVVDLRTGAPVRGQRAEILRRPTAPGSVMKIPTLIAALESGVAAPGDRYTCARRVRVAGQDLVCTHPDLARPLSPAEALAWSCNTAFASIARRLPRERFAAVLARHHLGPLSAGVDLAGAALGLRGVLASPSALLAMVREVVASRAKSADVVRQGMAGAVKYGTASALGAAGFTGYAKTGTVVSRGGQQHGFLIALVPEGDPRVGIAVVVAGAAGVDAARVAAAVLASYPISRRAPREGTPHSVITIGRTRGSAPPSVERLPIEEYVAGVVAAEGDPGASSAALEALAVTARTFALASRERHARDGYELCDLTHCQVLGRATTASVRAARATSGEVLRTASGDIAPVAYTASCGGALRAANEVWPGPPVPHMPAHGDPGAHDPGLWQAAIAELDLRRAVLSAGRRGDLIRDVHLGTRPGLIMVRGLSPAEISAEDLRLAVGRTLGWHLLKSAPSRVTRTAAGFRFEGTGRGHGAGLCVRGAGSLAQAGRGAREILAAYFPGLQVQSMERPRVRLMLPETQEAFRRDLEVLITRSVDEIARRLQIDPPPVVAVDVYADVGAYRRATGQPWWTAGSTANGRISLLPVAALRRRGILERTLRHEVVHLLTGAVLAGRPAWVQEGAARYFASPATPVARPPGAGTGAGTIPCPTDADLRGSRSPRGLREASERALVCFATSLQRRGDWRLVRPASPPSARSPSR